MTCIFTDGFPRDDQELIRAILYHRHRLPAATSFNECYPLTWLSHQPRPVFDQLIAVQHEPSATTVRQRMQNREPLLMPLSFVPVELEESMMAYGESFVVNLPSVPHQGESGSQWEVSPMSLDERREKMRVACWFYGKNLRFF